MTAWPSSLPQSPVQASFQGNGTPAVVQHVTDSGFVYQRPTSLSPPPRQYNAGFVLTRAQFAAFESFWYASTLNGSQRFAWKNPISEVPATCQFDASQGFPSHSVNGVWVRLSFTFWVYE